ncbi:MAG: hypothetical protein FD167_3870 [bacterium]|nr:MAG: hypothetical protein FD167_3870 [bacterium]
MSKVRSSKKTTGALQNNLVPAMVQIGDIGTLDEKPEETPSLLQIPPELEPEPIGRLIAEAGTHLITRQQLALIPTPLATKTYKPISHIKIVEALVETLSFRHISVVHDEYAISKDGGKCFGLLELSEEFTGCRFALGIRNSHDKSLRLAMVVGLRVLICSNLAFQGDFVPIKVKHSQKLELSECVSIGVDRMQRNFKPLQNQVEKWKGEFVSNDEARSIMFEALVDKKLPLPITLLPLVHKHYFKPEHEEFKDPSLWALANAFTSSFKQLKPIRQFQLTAKLGVFLERFTSPF